MFKTLLIAVTLLTTHTANASLIDRGNGLIYDTDLDITWLSDANYSMTSGYDDDGRMIWWEAEIWSNQLIYEGFDDWRLPSGGECINLNCNDSEMSHLFYNELGITAGSSILNSSDPDMSLFSNMQSYMYWSDYEYWLDSRTASYFASLDGFQGDANKYDYKYALAVHDGDIGAVPVPAAVWLFGSGLIGLIGFARRKKA